MKAEAKPRLRHAPMDAGSAYRRLSILIVPVFCLLQFCVPAGAQVAGAVQSASPAADTATSSSEDERFRLFQSTFGGKKSLPKTTSPHQALDMPLLIDGLEIARLQSKIVPGETKPRILLASLVAALTPLAEASVLARLTAHADADGFIKVEDIRGDGLSARFDLQSLSLDLTLPVALRRVHVINDGPQAPIIGPDGVVPTAALSAYVNLLGDLTYANGPGQPSGLQANVGVDGAVHLRGMILEGSLTYANSVTERIQRGDVRLVHDDTDDAVRYTAGDLNYSVEGFQSFLPMVGISFARNFTLQPYFIPQPTGSEQFVLNQQSQVQVFVNGIPNQTLTLPAGRYDIRNFPFTEGMNDVEIRTTDGVGRVTAISAPYFFSSSLLAAGVQSFSYSLGQPSSIGPTGYTYNTGRPSISAFHEIGVTDNLTVGANFQGSIAQQQLGGEFTFASEYGTVHADIASSHDAEDGFGTAVRLSYNLTDFRPQGSGSSLLAQATYTAPSFTSLGSLAPLNQTALDLGVRYAQRVMATFYASVGASFEFDRNGERNGHDLNFTLQHAFAPGLVVNLRVDQSIDHGEKPNIDALLAVSWQVGDGHSTVQSNYDSASQTAQASYQYTPTNFVGEPGGNIDIARRPDGEQATGTLFYNANRFEASLSENAVLPQNGGSDATEQTNLRVGTSLAYADGHFGVGRPIADSFAIVAPNENYADQNIVVDSSGTDGKYEAKTDFLGPAVQPDLTAYQIQPLSVTIPDLPIGYQLDRDRFQVLPTFRSGTVIVIGNDATVLLDGTLVDRNGAPLALLAGDIVTLDRKGVPVGEFFTNRQGRFRIEGVGPGTFVLRLEGDPNASAQVVIPPKTKGVYTVGEVKLETEAADEK